MAGAFLFKPSQQNHAARSPGERVRLLCVVSLSLLNGRVTPCPRTWWSLAESRFASNNRSSRSTAAPTPICETKPKPRKPSFADPRATEVLDQLRRGRAGWRVGQSFSTPCVRATVNDRGLGVRSVTRTGSLQEVIADGLTQIDLGQRIVVNLGGGDPLAITPRHERDLLLLAIGRGDGPIFGHLEIAAALDARRRRRCQRGEQDCRATRHACLQRFAHIRQRLEKLATAGSKFCTLVRSRAGLQW